MTKLSPSRQYLVDEVRGLRAKKQITDKEAEDLTVMLYSDEDTYYQTLAEFDKEQRAAAARADVKYAQEVEKRKQDFLGDMVRVVRNQGGDLTPEKISRMRADIEKDRAEYDRTSPEWSPTDRFGQIGEQLRTRPETISTVLNDSLFDPRSNNPALMFFANEDADYVLEQMLTGMGHLGVEGRPGRLNEMFALTDADRKRIAKSDDKAAEIEEIAAEKASSVAVELTTAAKITDKNAQQTFKEQMLAGGIRASLIRQQHLADIDAAAKDLTAAETAIAAGENLSPEQVGEIAANLNQVAENHARASMARAGMSTDKFRAMEGVTDPAVAPSVLAAAAAYARSEAKAQDLVKLAKVSGGDDSNGGKRGRAGSGGVDGDLGDDPFMRNAMNRVALRQKLADNQNFADWAYDHGVKYVEGMPPTPRQVSRYIRSARRAAGQPVRGTGRFVEFDVVDRSLGIDTPQGTMFFERDDASGEYVTPEEFASLSAAQLNDVESNPVRVIDAESDENRAALAAAFGFDNAFVEEMRSMDREIERNPKLAKGVKVMVDLSTGRSILVGPNQKVLAETRFSEDQQSQIARITQDPQRAQVVGSATKTAEKRGGNAMSSEEFASINVGDKPSSAITFVPPGTILSDNEAVKTVRDEVARTKAGESPNVFRTMSGDVYQIKDVRSPPKRFDPAELGVEGRGLVKARRDADRTEQRADSVYKRRGMFSEALKPVPRDLPPQAFAEPEAPDEAAPEKRAVEGAPWSKSYAPPYAMSKGPKTLTSDFKSKEAIARALKDSRERERRLGESQQDVRWLGETDVDLVPKPNENFTLPTKGAGGQSESAYNPMTYVHDKREQGVGSPYNPMSWSRGVSDAEDDLTVRPSGDISIEGGLTPMTPEELRKRREQKGLMP
jgi:hypothetical protein